MTIVNGHGAVAAPVEHIEEVEDILTAAPGWFERWGISAFLGAMMLLLALSWIVRYPDVVEGRLTLTGGKPPVPVVARRDGKVVTLLVREGQKVQGGARLAILESPAHAEDMLMLERTLGGWQATPEGTDQGALEQARSWQVGPLQGELAAFLGLTAERRKLVADSLHQRRLEALREGIEVHRRLGRSLRDQVDLRREAAALAEGRQANDERLRAEGFLATSLADESRQTLLEQRLSLEESQAGALRNDALVAEYHNRLLELEQQRTERLLALERQLRESLERLRQGLASWQFDHVLTAPTGGTVTFFDVWTGDQLARAGREAMYVVPEPEAGVVLGRVHLAQRGVGRVREGQRVRLELDGYPAAQFGAVTGRVRSLSATARGDEYVVTVAFPQGLRTTFGRSLPLRQGLTGRALIVTEDRRLLERLLGPLRYLTDRSKGEA